MKWDPEKLVIKTTPYARNFRLQNSIITLIKQVKVGRNTKSQQLLMDIVVGRSFSFTIRIVKCKSGWIAVGVADRDLQYQTEFSHKSGKTVCYYSYSPYDKGGRILYGEGDEGKLKETGDPLK